MGQACFSGTQEYEDEIDLELQKLMDKRNEKIRRWKKKNWENIKKKKNQKKKNFYISWLGLGFMLSIIDQCINTVFRECVRAGAGIRRSLGHHLLHPLILRLLVLCAPADFQDQSSLL